MSLQKNYKKFRFTGKAVLGEKAFEIDKVSQNAGKLDWTMSTANIGIEIENGNRVYPRLSSGFNSDSKLYVSLKNSDGTIVEGKTIVNFKDRFTHPDVKDLKNVHDVSLIKVGLTKDENDKTVYKSFLTSYDAVEYVKANLKEGEVITVSGDVRYQEYNDKVSAQYDIKTIFLSQAEPKDFKAIVTQEVFFDSNILGTKTDGTLVDLFGFVSEYNKEHEYVCYPLVTKIDTVQYPKWKTIVDAFLTPKSSTGLVGVNLECSIKLEDGTVATDKVEPSKEVQAMMAMGMWETKDVETKLNDGSNRSRNLVLERIMIDTKGNAMINRDGKASDIKLASDLLEKTATKTTPKKAVEEAANGKNEELDDLLASMGM